MYFVFQNFSIMTKICQYSFSLFILIDSQILDVIIKAEGSGTTIFKKRCEQWLQYGWAALLALVLAVGIGSRGAANTRVAMALPLLRPSFPFFRC